MPTTRRDILRSGIGLAAILTAGQAPAVLVKSMPAASKMKIEDDPGHYRNQIEYIESSTGEQYIELEFIATDQISFSCEITRPNNNTRWDMGAETDYSNNIARLIIQEQASCHWRYGAYSPIVTNVSYSGNLTGRIKFDVNKDKCDCINLSSGKSYSFKSTGTRPFYTPCNFYVFGVGVVNQVSVSSLTKGMRLHSLDISDVGYSASLKPVIDHYNEPCLYDRISGQLIYNRGAGSFLAGPRVEG